MTSEMIMTLLSFVTQLLPFKELSYAKLDVMKQDCCTLLLVGRLKPISQTLFFCERDIYEQWKS